MNAHFLTEEEKFHATKRLANNQTGIATKNSRWKWDQALEAVLDVRVWLVFSYNLAINIPNGGLATFGSIIIKNLGFTALEASLLTMPFGLFCTFGAWIFSTLAANWTNRRTIVASIACLFPITGTIIACTIPGSVVPAQMIGLYLMYLYWRKYFFSSLIRIAHCPPDQLNFVSSLRRIHFVTAGKHGRQNEEGSGFRHC